MTVYTVEPFKTGFAVMNGDEVISFSTNEESVSAMADRLNGPKRGRKPAERQERTDG